MSNRNRWLSIAQEWALAACAREKRERRKSICLQEASFDIEVEDSLTSAPGLLAPVVLVLLIPVCDLAFLNKRHVFSSSFAAHARVDVRLNFLCDQLTEPSNPKGTQGKPATMGAKSLLITVAVLSLSLLHLCTCCCCKNAFHAVTRHTAPNMSA